MSPIESTGRLTAQMMTKMSANNSNNNNNNNIVFDELDECCDDYQQQLNDNNKDSNNVVVAGDTINRCVQQQAISGKFYQNLTKRTTNRLCHWVQTNWPTTTNRKHRQPSGSGGQSSAAAAQVATSATTSTTATTTTTTSSTGPIDLRQCLPPMYHNSKNMAKNIKEQKRKLFHSPVYESEQQLKKLYIQTCKRLPAYGCRLFHVKELLRGKTNRRATRLLGICLERIVLLDSKTLQPSAKCQPTSQLQQWRTGGGRSHDRLVLEFRGTKWSFITPSHSSLRAIGTVLWEIMQDLDSRFLDDILITDREQLDDDCRRAFRHGFGYGLDNKVLQFRDELLRLESLLHFPEEVALRLTDVEYQLFYSIAPIHYIRQVTIGLSNRESFNIYNTNQSIQSNIDMSMTVKKLIDRFNEVSSWVTHIIISQPTHEMRKAVLSCIMRVAQCCWNMANFNSATEILAGLKSEKLKPFWLSICTKDQPVLKERLSSALLSMSGEPSAEYRSAVTRALDIPDSKVIPFFGAFLKDLKCILRGMPSLVVLPVDDDDYYYTVAGNDRAGAGSNARNVQQINLDFIADFNGDDHYMSRIGVGGIINMEKMYKTHEVLDNIRAFHLHQQRRQHQQQQQQLLLMMDNNNDTVGKDPPPPPMDTSISPTNSYCLNQMLYTCGGGIAGDGLTHKVIDGDNSNNNAQEDDLHYKLDVGDTAYRPIQPLANSGHGVSFVPISIDGSIIDLHQLQAMHHGLTCVHYEEDTGRSAVVYLQLEQSNATLIWCRPTWSTAIRTQTGVTPQDYSLPTNIEDTVQPAIVAKYESKEPAILGLDEGYIDLQYVKDVRIGQSSADLTLIARRHGLSDSELLSTTAAADGYNGSNNNNNSSVKLLFGTNLSDNRSVEFISPKSVATVWSDGLRCLFRLQQQQKQLTDQRIVWLKDKYLQLYYEDAVCSGPTPAEAIRVFGGRKWTLDAMGAGYMSSSTPTHTDLSSSAAAAAVAGAASTANKHKDSANRIKKKKSSVSLTAARDSSPRGGGGCGDLDPSPAGSAHGSPSIKQRIYNLKFQSSQNRLLQSSAAAATAAAATAVDKSDADSRSNIETISNVSGGSSCDVHQTAGSGGGGRLTANTGSGPTIHTNSLTHHYREKFSTTSTTPTPSKTNQTTTHNDSTTTGAGVDSHLLTPSKLPTTKTTITHSSQMNFLEFQELFRSFIIRSRRDIKDIFEQIATKPDIHLFGSGVGPETVGGGGDTLTASITTTTTTNTTAGGGPAVVSGQQQQQHPKLSIDLTMSPTMSTTSDVSGYYCGGGGNNTNTTTTSSSSQQQMLGLLTRNSAYDRTDDSYQKSRIFDAIAAASIVANSSGIDTLKTMLLTATDFQAFILTYQCESVTIDDVRQLIQRHEPNPAIRRRRCLSFEGFARYLMDKDNYAYTPERYTISEHDMNEPLSHYYMASSHNTYLTGHQLRGESSVELYSQVLSTGCRCVELDCWDGDDGLPVIYHGHTLTSKISFKKVIEIINDKAFVASPYPVILSLENHCSLPQQIKMAQIFVQIFGDKLVTRFMFDSDYWDEPQLPSPNHLRYRILIKNKKLKAPAISPQAAAAAAAAMNMPRQMRGMSVAGTAGNPTTATGSSPYSKSFSGRTNSLISTASTGSLNEEEDDEYEDEEDDDEALDDALQALNAAAAAGGGGGGGGRSNSSVGGGGDQQQQQSVVTKSPAVKTESSSSQECASSYGGGGSDHISSSTTGAANTTTTATKSANTHQRSTSSPMSVRSPRSHSDTSDHHHHQHRQHQHQHQQQQQQQQQQRLVYDAADYYAQQMSTISTLHAQNKANRKSSSQIAPELSDLVIYCQAIKFRGFSATTANSGIGGGGGGIGLPTASPTMTAGSASAAAAGVIMTGSSMPTKKMANTRKLVASAGAVPGGTGGSVIAGQQLPGGGECKSPDIRDSVPSPTPMSSAVSSMATTTNNNNIPLTTVTANRRPTVNGACYQVSSINENTAKKLCRKSPLAVIGHTVGQIMRTYPAGMRIDSSNFNPVIFWAFGLQSVALNYQTVDSALHINQAMFEQNGGCGLVPKPPVMRDRQHVMFGRFNPWDKEFDGLHAINLTITIISGQYVCPTTNTGSPLVELEVIGIPVDSVRQRTKIVQRNSLNPIWNDTFMFRVTFSDLAFLRFSVTDAGTNHVASQRVLPLQCLRQGYRHLRLRSPQNQSLQLSSLFIYSQYEEEGLDYHPGACGGSGGVQQPYGSDGDRDGMVNGQSQVTTGGTGGGGGSGKQRTRRIHSSAADFSRLDSRDQSSAAAAPPPVRRRMFFLVIHGVVADEPSTILKITQDSTSTDVIHQALTKAGKPVDTAADYVLIEEVQRGWDRKRVNERNITQRILDPEERPLEAQSQWKGEGRYVLKKVSDDPSTRAWMSSIRNAQKDRQRNNNTNKLDSNNPDLQSDQLANEWTDETYTADTFLVCIYNVSPDQPYTILKSSADSTAADIITQALVKARRPEPHQDLALIEELEYFTDTGGGCGYGGGGGGQESGQTSSSSSKKSGIKWRRVLADDECVYYVQQNWKTKGKFELKLRKDLTATDMTADQQSGTSRDQQSSSGTTAVQKLLQRNRHSLKRLTHFHRSSSRSRLEKYLIHNNNTNPSTASPPIGAAVAATRDSPSHRRQTHSEGEMPSDDETGGGSGGGDQKAGVGSKALQRLTKKLSFRKLRGVWK